MIRKRGELVVTSLRLHAFDFNPVIRCFRNSTSRTGAVNYAPTRDNQESFMNRF